MLLFYFIYSFILAVLVQLMRSSFPDQGTGQGFPGGASGKEPTCQYRRHKRGGFGPRVREIPWRRAWQPNSVCLPGKSHGQRKLAGYSPWGHRELDSTEQLTLSLSGASSFLFLGLSFVLMKWWVWTMWSPRCPLVFYHLRVLWCSLPLMERSPKSIAGDPAHMSLFWERRV